MNPAIPSVLVALLIAASPVAQHTHRKASRGGAQADPIAAAKAAPQPVLTVEARTLRLSASPGAVYTVFAAGGTDANAAVAIPIHAMVIVCQGLVGPDGVAQIALAQLGAEAPQPLDVILRAAVAADGDLPRLSNVAMLRTSAADVRDRSDPASGDTIGAPRFNRSSGNDTIGAPRFNRLSGNDTIGAPRFNR